MSVKMSRKTTPAPASTTSYTTPQPSSSSSSQRSRSPLSPTRVSRLQEKHDLQHLNDRLAVYMDTVRSLEHENARLIREAKTTTETISREKASYRAMYDQELNDARRLLDEIASEKARYEIENKRLREENEDLKSSLDKKTKEVRSLESSLSITEHRFADLQSKYNKAAADNKKLEDENKEIDKLRKALEFAKKSAENETLARVELENKLMSLKEETQFQEQVLKKEVTELRVKRQEEITEIDGRLTVEYESKLQAALQELREQHELQQQTNRNEITDIYETKLKALEKYHQRSLAASTSSNEEFRSLQSRYDGVNSKLAALEATNAANVSRISDLEKLLESERTRNAERLALMEQDLQRARDEISAMLKDYQDLMDIKVALDTEIAAYRKLLEFEESRLRITPAGVRRATPSRRGTPLASQPAAKRRRVLLKESEEMDHFQVTGEAKGDIEICDVDPAGKFIKLLNKSQNEIAIGGWTLKHQAGDQDTVFKFHRSVKIDGKGNVTVWGADSGRTHEPPQNIVMKMKWYIGDLCNTALINTDGEEVATRQRQRVHYTSSLHREEEGEDDTVDAGEREQCSIM